MSPLARHESGDAQNQDGGARKQCKPRVTRTVDCRVAQVAGADVVARGWNTENCGESGSTLALCTLGIRHSFLQATAYYINSLTKH